MSFEVDSWGGRPRVVVAREIQRRQRPRHHIDLAQLFHFETGVW